MTKARTASASVTTPLSDRPSNPHEKETAPDGKKLSPNWSTASACRNVAHSVLHAMRPDATKCSRRST